MSVHCDHNEEFRVLTVLRSCVASKEKTEKEKKTEFERARESRDAEARRPGPFQGLRQLLVSL